MVRLAAGADLWMARLTAGPRAAGIALLALVGLAEVSLLAILAWWPGLPVPTPGLALFGLAFGVYLGGWGVARRASEDGRRTLLLVWGVGLALRGVMLPVAPELSDDVWRYLWDGHVQLQGLDPWSRAPGDPALDPVATPWRPLINNPEVPTIYPPAAQGAFRVIALLGGGVLQAKLLWLVLDLATAAALALTARRTGRPRAPILLLYLWSPLLVVETAWNAHLDVLGLLGLALVLLAAGAPSGRARSVPAAAGAALALATLTKFAPAAALPPLARRLGVRFVAAFAGTVLLLYLPWIGVGEALFRGLGTYARHWRFNELAFLGLEWLAPGGAPPRVVAAALVMGLVAWATWRRWSVERSLLWILGTGLVLSPTLHPWYALWMLPVAALRQSRAWIVFTGTAFVGYLGLATYRDGGVWPQPLWGRLLLWVPVAALLVHDHLGRRRSARSREGQGAPGGG